MDLREQLYREGLAKMSPAVDAFNSKQVSELESLKGMITGAIVIIVGGLLAFMVHWALAILGVIVGVFMLFGAKKKYSQVQSMEFNDYIDSLGAFSLPLKAYSPDDDCFICDISGVTATRKFTFEIISRMEEFREMMIFAHDFLENPNVVLEKSKERKMQSASGEQKLFDNESLLLDAYEDMKAILDSIESHTIDIPILDPWESQTQSMLDLAKPEAAAGWPKLEYWNDGDIESQIKVWEEADKISSQIDMDQDEFVDREKEFVTTAQGHLNAVRDMSLNELAVDYFNNLSCNSDYLSHYFFCPACNKKIIEGYKNLSFDFNPDEGATPSRPQANTKMVYNLEEGIWECPVCKGKTNNPFPIHKIMYDLLYPTFEFLIQEHHEERLRLYTDTQFKTREYKKQWEQEAQVVIRKNRAETETLARGIREIRTELAKDKHAIMLFDQEMQNLQSRHMTRMKEISSETLAITRSIDEKQLASERRLNEVAQQVSRQMNADMDRHSRTAQLEKQAQFEMLQRTAENTSSIAESSARTAAATESIQESSAQTAASTMYMSKQMGGREKPWWNVPGNIAEGLGDLGATVTGQSGVEREQNRMKKN